MPPPLISEETLRRAAWLSRRSKVQARSVALPHEAWRLRGVLPGTEERLTALTIGPAGFGAQLVHAFLGEITERERLGQVGRFDDRQRWASAEDDLVARVLRPWERPGPEEIPMAAGVDARITLEGTPEEHAQRHLAREHRRAWNHRVELGAEYQISGSAADLRFWYESLHVPLTHHRHRENAHVARLEELAPHPDRTEVLLVRIGGQVVAGALLEHDPWTGTLTRTATGAPVAVAENGKLYKNLTVALEYRALERAHERGISHYSLGFTIPRVDGGLFGYKRRWGAGFYPDTWAWPSVVQLRSRRKPRILERTAVITQPAGQTAVLLGTTGDDDQAIAALRERIKLAAFPNARRLLVHAASPHVARLRQALADLSTVSIEEVPGAEVTRQGAGRASG
jgi:hypothetical protein